MNLLKVTPFLPVIPSTGTPADLKYAICLYISGGDIEYFCYFIGSKHLMCLQQHNDLGQLLNFSFFTHLLSYSEIYKDGIGTAIEFAQYEASVIFILHAISNSFLLTTPHKAWPVPAIKAIKHLKFYFPGLSRVLTDRD